MELIKIINRLKYRVVSNVIKYFLPSLYSDLRVLTINGKLSSDICKIISDTPRQSIIFMKKYFKNKIISGVEIGVADGNNSLSILKELNIGKLYLIDIWNDYDDYLTYSLKNKMNYVKVLKVFKKDNRIEIIKAFSIIGSKRIKDNSLDFCYIDGNHDYNYVYQDLDCFYKKVRKNGVIAGHDIFNWNDVYRVVNDWCIEHNIKYFIQVPDWYFIKK